MSPGYIVSALAAMVALLAVCVILPACAGRRVQNHDARIATLDSLLNEQGVLEKAKLGRIADLRRRSRGAITPTEKYALNALLYEEFSTYQSDSAMKYIDRNIALAQSAGNYEWEIKGKINKSSLLAATGLLQQSLDVMLSIKRADIPDELLTEYYGQMIFLYSHMGNYAGGDNNDYYVKERAYKDSIVSVIGTDHPGHLWFKGWDVLGTPQRPDSVIAALEKKLAGRELATHQDAKDAYILAKLYEAEGDRDNFRKYMATSAIVDVKMANAEIASLEDLAKIMMDEGDVDRAYTYINYSLNKAISFPNRVKAFSITRTLDQIYTDYQRKNERQQKVTLTYLIILSVLSAVLIGLVALIIVQNVKLRRSRRNLSESNGLLHDKIAALSEAERRLNETNAELKDLNARLKQKNEELNEANYVKEEYIGYVFNICSNYISKLGDLKRNIHVKAIARKYKEIEVETADLDMKGELKEFYHSFDTIFLHIYPNFVNDFNTLLQDDKQIYPKEGELLNTELRIYALVRLGITDSVKISDFLHCSAQTVYNNRFKVRNKAKISKKEFADSVRNLGKFMDRTS